ncbi:MAG: hypothetical protein PHH37_10280 [Paludibacter sp.]|nr:hypothetical protein [Paludibacter sp.]
MTSISGVPSNFPTADLNVTYTDFKKIKTLTEGSKYYELTYGVDDSVLSDMFILQVKGGVRRV